MRQMREKQLTRENPLGELLHYLEGEIAGLGPKEKHLRIIVNIDEDTPLVDAGIAAELALKVAKRSQKEVLTIAADTDNTKQRYSITMEAKEKSDE